MASNITVYQFHLSNAVKQQLKNSKKFGLLSSKLDNTKDCICIFLTPDRAVAQVLRLSFIEQLKAHFGNERKALKALFRAFRKYLYAVKEPARQKTTLQSELTPDISKAFKMEKRFELEGNEVVIYLEEPKNENTNGAEKDQ
jgi:hypothetical protein